MQLVGCLRWCRVVELVEEVGGLGMGFAVPVDFGNLVMEEISKIVTEFL